MINNTFLKKITLKKIFVFLNSVVIIFVIVGALILYSIFNEKPPQFFPLNNPAGEYKIVKGCPNGQGSGSPLIGQEKLFCVEYKGTGVWSNKEANFFSITVGNSKIDLEPLDGKKVKNIKGAFVASNQQCIQERCIKFVNMVVLDIDELELSK